MKRLLFLALSVVSAACIYAVPAKRGIWKILKMADGTEIKAELNGDEFGSYYKDADGRVFTLDSETGLYKTADMNEITKKADAKRREANMERASRIKKIRGNAAARSNSYTGEKKGLIILVQFSDVKFNNANTPELYRRIANEEGFADASMGFKGSVKDYFKAQSNGMFSLDFDVEGPVTMPNGYAFYGAPTANSDDNDMEVGKMIIAACQEVDSRVNFKDYDWDGDGEADQVFILYAGKGEASCDDVNTIWPHEWTLASACRRTVTLDGVKINTYACGNEIDDNGNIAGIGTICHEFSHCLGLPDMYDYNNRNFGMSLWDLMDYGSYNDDGFTPPNYTSYERMYIGWQQPIELKNDIEINDMKSLSDNGNTYIIYNEGHKDEYYLLENRQRKGWDAGLPGDGMLILHVDYDAYAWNYNEVNTGSQQHCTIFHADNQDKTSKANLINDLYPYGSNNSLTNTSIPAATINNKNTDGSFYMNKEVKDITRNPDGTMSFKFFGNNASGIDGISAGTRHADNRIYSIDGRYIGNDKKTLNKGIYIINGKKYIK